MLAHQVAAAFLAVLPMGEFGFFERRYMLGAGSDSHCVWLPQAESVNRATRPGST
jgi:hypothetical protein